jgi:hypothetical protein
MVLFSNGVRGEVGNEWNIANSVNATIEPTDVALNRIVIHPNISVTITGTLSDDVEIGTPNGRSPTHFVREFALPGTFQNTANGIWFTPLTGGTADVTVESE